MCNIIGQWKSELNSVLKMERVVKNQMFGTYTTQTGSTQGTYTMTGFVGFTEEGFDEAVGWVVSWNSGDNPENSVTTWTGQLQKNSEGEPVIVATWLYCKGTKPGEEWSSTLIGSNTFQRLPETQ